MPINFDHVDDLELFVSDNINLINNKITSFRKSADPRLKFDDIDIKRFLNEKLLNNIKNDPNYRQNLLTAFSEKDFKKKNIAEIAIENGLYKKHLEAFYESYYFDKLKTIDINSLSTEVTSIILNKVHLEGKEKNYIKSGLNNILKKTLFLTTQNGFLSNINNNETGVMDANAGDSAQFLFLSRAILAGYNCSNVDVRSSRYDAVIDFNGHLFRVQVKGISNGSTAQFKDRDRGGRGIDHNNERNKGDRITSADCDIYVAVDKQVGICYIIPTSKIDEWDCDSKPIKDLQHYKENWKIIDSLLEE